MNAHALSAPLAQPREPGSNSAFLLAVAVHVLLFTVLFFGVSWNTQQPSPIMAELWSQIPNVPPPAPVTPVVPPPEPVIPKPLPKVDPVPIPKPVVKEPPKPDIALEQEKERKKKEADAKAAEAKVAAEKKKLEADRVRREAEAERKRMLAQLNNVPDVATAPIKGPTTRGDPRVLSAGYSDKVRAKIRGNIVLPNDLPGNPEALVDVEQLPTGEVLHVKIRKSSGFKSYDEAVERAVLKSSPLPLPEKGEPVPRSLELKFRPIE